MPKAREYRRIADNLASDILAGRLKPGERLLPQREFAYQHKIAPSTASRVYSELVKRGVVTGEVGRGTYVKSAPHIGSALLEPAEETIDLQLNVSVLPGQAALMAPALSTLLHSGAFQSALAPIGGIAHRTGRQTVAEFLARGSWMPHPDHILFAGSGRQAIAAALAAVASIGDRVGVERMTYPVVKGTAARLGIELVPIDMDEDGLCLDSLEAAHRRSPLKAIYFQPSLHNPIGMTMGPQRRAQIAAFLQHADVMAIEDAVYAFLAGDMPFAASAPTHTIVIESLSKRLAPGITLGMLCVPPIMKERVASELRTGGWAAHGFPLAAAIGWILDGTAERVVEAKQNDAKARQVIARNSLAGLLVHGDPRAYHLWLELPGYWRADAFVAAAARRGVAVTPASVFAAEPGYAPKAVRLAPAPPTLDMLSRGLSVLKNLALSTNEDVVIE